MEWSVSGGRQRTNTGYCSEHTQTHTDTNRQAHTKTKPGLQTVDCRIHLNMCTLLTADRLVLHTLTSTLLLLLQIAQWATTIMAQWATVGHQHYHGRCYVCAVMRGLKQARVLGFDAGWAAMMRLLHKGRALICVVGMNDNGIEREG